MLRSDDSQMRTCDGTRVIEKPPALFENAIRAPIDFNRGLIDR